MKRFLSRYAHWFTINDNRYKEGDLEKEGALIKQGRFILYYDFMKNDGRGDYPHKLEFGWHLFSNFCNVSFTIAAPEHDGPSITLFIGIPYLVTFWITHSIPNSWCERILPRYHSEYEVDGVNRVFDWPSSRKIEFSVHHNTFWWSIWEHPHGGSDGMGKPLPKWRSGNLDFFDFILGRHIYKLDTLTPEHPVMIWLPEGGYPATLKVEKQTWKRKRWPRWPLKTERVSRSINCEIGIPFPGKGENSWDCGEDGLYGTGFDTPNDTQACAKFAERVLDCRRRYGGKKCAEEPWPESPEVRKQAYDERMKNRPIEQGLSR